MVPVNSSIIVSGLCIWYLVQVPGVPVYQLHLVRWFIAESGTGNNTVIIIAQLQRTKNRSPAQYHSAYHWVL